jgi:hypothetical protein
MRYVFLVALFCSIATSPALTREQLPSPPTAQPSPFGQFLLVEESSGELLVFHGALKLARCTVADAKIACTALGPAAMVVPAIKGQPAPDGAPAGGVQ